MNISEVIAESLVNGGGTYSVASQPMRFEKTIHEFGFYVSRPNGVENLPFAALSTDVLMDVVLARHYDSGLYLGLWKDENNNWSIDETEWFLFKDAAIAAGIRNNQRAIWDIENGEAITL